MLSLPNSRSLTHFIPGHISDSRPLNVFMLTDDERCHITINPLTRNWSALLLNSNYMAKLQARGVWTHFVVWLKTIHQGQQLSHSTYRTCLHVGAFERPFVSEHDLYLNLPLKGSHLMHSSKEEGSRLLIHALHFLHAIKGVSVAHALIWREIIQIWYQYYTNITEFLQFSWNTWAM